MSLSAKQFRIGEGRFDRGTVLLLRDLLFAAGAGLLVGFVALFILRSSPL